MKLLSLSCVFPNPQEPGLGVFVRARLQAISAAAQVKVVAPIASLDYSRLFARRGKITPRRSDGAMDIFHPRWLYLPAGVATNPALLALRLFPLVRETRKQYPFDWIDSHFAFPDGIATAILARWFRVPFSITFRGNETMHAGRSKAIRASMRWAVRRADCIITVSESLRQFAISLGAEPQRIRTIPNGVDDHIFYPRNREVCRRRLGLSHDRKTIVSAGSLIERKGHHHIIQAVSSLWKHGINAELLVVGGPGREGNYSGELQRMPAALGISDRVRFLGQVTPDAMAEAMSAADLFCLASSREGWPNVVHEAMACGTPVVTTNVGGTPEMVPSERYGKVVPPADSAALETAIYEALTSTWDRDAIRAWAHSRSWENVAGEVLDLLRSTRAQRFSDDLNR